MGTIFLVLYTYLRWGKGVIRLHNDYLWLPVPVLSKICSTSSSDRVLDLGDFSIAFFSFHFGEGMLHRSSSNWHYYAHFCEDTQIWTHYFQW